MAEAWFVDEGVNILRGAAAEAAIRDRSDARHLVPGKGIVRIPAERWKIAQTFERTGWMEKWRGTSDDRNLLHAEACNHYHALAGRRFEHAIELGCGPFTNIRVIADIADIAKTTLLDPLMASYLELPKCRYSRTELRTHSASRVIPIAETMICPIEEMPVENRRYDLVVMMNVIEHCFDVQKIFEKILAITAPGAIFVFHDAIYDADKTASVVKGHYYEAGHPLMVAFPLLQAFMKDHFETLHYTEVPEPADQIEVCPHVGLFYFIGRRR
ncbi:MAG: class I SAM-dependent methyltransferase [Phycisphaerae bacterium]